MKPWYNRTGEGWLLTIHAQPGAKKNEVAGLHGDALKIRVASPPIEGRANKALTDYIAQTLNIARNKVMVLRGEKGRDKQILVAVPEADLRRLFPE